MGQGGLWRRPAGRKCLPINDLRSLQNFSQVYALDKTILYGRMIVQVTSTVQVTKLVFLEN